VGDPTVARRAIRPAEPLSSSTSTGRDIDPWLSPDRRVIVFSSDRSGF
jgi:Tol biopolymer transport system component